MSTTHLTRRQPFDHDDGDTVEKASLNDADSVEVPKCDPFVPFTDDPGAPVESHSQILTVRAVLTGCVLGGLVNASNIYLGLKTGWTFSASLFGAIFGFGLLKFLSLSLPTTFPVLGGPFGPKENSIVQTAATAAGGLGSIFVSAVPALYQLRLLHDPVRDFPRLLSFTAVSAYYGLLFATPLRQFFVIHVARELHLVFPTATATAMTIRSMHALGGAAGGAAARRRTRALAAAFGGAFGLRVAAAYVPGVLWDWHVWSWVFVWGGYGNGAIHVENWGWLWEWTPAFVGSGMLVGLNSAMSFLGGSVLAWGIIGPALVRNGVAHGVAVFTESDAQWEKWHDLTNFHSFALADPKHAPSPRYWLLWPGVFVMICTSFAELAVQYKLLWHGARCVWTATAAALHTLRPSNAWLARHAAPPRPATAVADPAPPAEHVKPWQWGLPLALTIAATCVVLALQYHLSVEMSFLAVLLGFIFAFLAIQCTGATDTTPLTTAAKASQLLLGAASSGQNYPVHAAQRMNLIGGAVASGAAAQSTDLVVDFRVGFLLRTPPRLQWYAQALGSVVAVFLSPAMFIVFMRAYPCVLDAAAPACAFAGPSVAAWRAVAVAVTSPELPVPPSSAAFALALGIVAAASVVLRHNLRMDRRAWVPNFMALGLGFVMPQTQYASAMAAGAVLAWAWQRRRPAQFEMFCYAIAAGMIAGEGLGGVMNAFLEIGGVGAARYGSAVGCPGEIFCG
ncbi:OPT oligopeptide transporter protein-domain-containing protein [Geopyxis carbonaria]|nr:OPT oligopeptide transporter protein-domain-containing protein [Geopyxis carbonaria]